MKNKSIAEKQKILTLRYLIKNENLVTKQKKINRNEKSNKNKATVNQIIIENNTHNQNKNKTTISINGEMLEIFLDQGSDFNTTSTELIKLK